MFVYFVVLEKRAKASENKLLRAGFWLNGRKDFQFVVVVLKWDGWHCEAGNSPLLQVLSERLHCHLFEMCASSWRVNINGLIPRPLLKACDAMVNFVFSSECFKAITVAEPT